MSSILNTSLVMITAFAAWGGGTEPERWSARWASHPEAGREFGVYHFRKAFNLPAKPASFPVHVTADNRYELFVNGTRVSTGPARGDLQHWRFVTLDIAPHLRIGRNVLAAVVWNWGRYAPAAQFTNETGLLVQGNSPAEAMVNTAQDWKCARDTAYAPLKLKPGYPVGVLAGAGEAVQGSDYPWGWQQPDYDDSGWIQAVPAGNAMPRGRRVDEDRWLLVPDTLPAMEDREERLVKVVRTTGVVASPQFVLGHAPLVIPEQSQASILLDQGFLTTAYPELMVSGGRGAGIQITYSEALYKPQPGVRPSRWPKGNRDEAEGKQILGLTDLFVADGGSARLYRPLWWRTYRYVQLDIQTAAAPLTVLDLKGRFTAYPFQGVASIETSDPELARIWTAGWRTARLCAHETYMDCPYYEQMQYVGDTRIQALISLYVSGDDRLMRNAIAQFDQSRISDGITYSRYPSNVPQFIPTFSLWWVNMVHDYWMHREDDAFVRSCLPGVRSVLAWFETHAESSGLSGRLPWWPFVDWVPRWPHGIPPGGDTGASAIVSLQWAGALQDAAEMESALGDATTAERDRMAADRILKAVRQTCWNPGKGLFADSPRQDSFSQHANILAVLQEAVPPREGREVIEKVLSDPELAQTTYYFRHYLSRAANRVGLGDRYLEMLAPWREMLKIGLSTWAETPEPTRSDCHAWSASPNYELLATVAGIEPGEPGFRSVRVRPHLGALPWLRAKMPHPRGTIEVDLKNTGGRPSGWVTLPAGLQGVWEHGGQRQGLAPGRNRIRP